MYLIAIFTFILSLLLHTMAYIAHDNSFDCLCFKLMNLFSDGKNVKMALACVHGIFNFKF